jgi:hypothetical protein
MSRPTAELDESWVCFLRIRIIENIGILIEGKSVSRLRGLAAARVPSVPSILPMPSAPCNPYLASSDLFSDLLPTIIYPPFASNYNTVYEAFYIYGEEPHSRLGIDIRLGRSYGNPSDSILALTLPYFSFTFVVCAIISLP